MATATPDPAPPYPLRFSIRLPRPLWSGVATGVVVIVAIGLQIGVPIYRQHLAKREIERLGGAVAGFRLRGPNWLRTRLDADWMRPIDVVIGIDLRDSQGIDSKVDQTHVSYLADINLIWLDNAQFSDAGLTRLKTLTNLECLSLANTQVTDVGMSHLKGLPSLQELSVDNTNVTDAGLEQLAGLTGLRSLQLGNTQLTDAGLAHLAGLINLESLGLRNTEVTDRGLAYLKGLTRLRSLDLDNTRVTDGGIADLKRTVRGLEVR